MVWQRVMRWRQPVVSVVRLQGKIQAGSRGPNVINYDNTLPQIKKAFGQSRLAAVALRINSPGGSPVQCSLIHACIRRLASERQVPVLAFVEDVAASGGYYLACAADKIFANRHSVIGSIGAISLHLAVYSGLNQLQMPVTVHRAGKRKAIGTPMEPETQESTAMKRYLLAGIHQDFIDVVKANRGSRLQAGKENELFEGDVWLSEKAQSLGLIDGIGDLETIVRDQVVKEFRLREIRSLSHLAFPRLSLQAAAASTLQGNPVLAQAAAAAAAVSDGDSGTDNLLLWRSSSF